MHNEALVRHEVRVVRDYQHNLPPIVVDKHKLLQILVNLICNASALVARSDGPGRGASFTVDLPINAK